MVWLASRVSANKQTVWWNVLSGSVEAGCVAVVEGALMRGEWSWLRQNFGFFWWNLIPVWWHAMSTHKLAIPRYVSEGEGENMCFFHIDELTDAHDWLRPDQRCVSVSWCIRKKSKRQEKFNLCSYEWCLITHHPYCLPWCHPVKK